MPQRRQSSVDVVPRQTEFGAREPRESDDDIVDAHVETCGCCCEPIETIYVTALVCREFAMTDARALHVMLSVHACGSAIVGTFDRGDAELRSPRTQSARDPPARHVGSTERERACAMVETVPRQTGGRRAMIRGWHRPPKTASPCAAR